MKLRSFLSEEETASRLRKANLSLVRNTYRYLGEFYYLVLTVRLDDGMISRLLKEMARDIDSSPVGKESLERFLDDHLECAVSRLRAAAPRLGENDIALFCYLTVGFKPSLIAELLETTVNNVYTRKYRLIARIGRLGPARAKPFLELIG